MSSTTMGHKIHKREDGTSSKHDWGMFFGGIAVLIIGFALMIWPGLTLLSIAALAGIVLLAIGVFDIIAYFHIRKGGRASGWAIVNAVCDIILGIVFLTNPVLTAEVIPWVAGAFVCAYGIFAVIAAIRLRKTGPGWGFMLANGIIALICGLSFVIVPATFVIFLGLFLAMRGTTMAVFGVMAPQALPYV